MKTVKYLYVYILKCSDNSFYVGITNNPELRLKQHNYGIKKESYTYNKRPVHMLYCEQFSNFTLAIEWENKIKKWSRAKKQVLIDRNWGGLKKLSVCQNSTNSNNFKSNLSVSTTLDMTLKTGCGKKF